MRSQKMSEELILIEQLTKALKGVMGGVTGYESEGLDVKRFWNPVSIGYAITILAKAERFQGRK